MGNGFRGEILDRKEGKTLARDIERVIDNGSLSVQAIRGSAEDPTKLETTFHRKDDILVRGVPVENYRPPIASDATFGTATQWERDRTDRDRR